MVSTNLWSQIEKESLGSGFPQLSHLGTKSVALAEDVLVGGQHSGLKETLQQLAARGVAAAGSDPTNDEAPFTVMNKTRVVSFALFIKTFDLVVTHNYFRKTRV